MIAKSRATIEDLYRVPENGKAEIVNGELVHMSPTGHLPSRAGFNIAASLREHERRTRAGRAYPDNTGFKVNLPNRDSFSPEASYYTGQPTGMRFLEGAPVFAAEVRSESDYGPEAEREMAAKRADKPGEPTVYRRGEMAEAEPAVPGWTMPVDDLFL